MRSTQVFSIVPFLLACTLAPVFDSPAAALDPVHAEAGVVPVAHRRPSPQPAPRAAIQDDQLRDQVRRVIAWYEKKLLNTRDHSPWEVMHAIVAYGVETQIRQDGPRGVPITAIGWLCFNRPTKNQRLLYLQDGRLRAVEGPGLQGHPGQFLAMLAQSRLLSDYPIQVRDSEFTVADLIEEEKLSCYSGTELTFKLIALNHYLEPDAQWQNRHGETWTIPRLVSEELRQPLRGAACGGTHRLAGISMAVLKRQKLGLPEDDLFREAKRYMQQHQHFALRMQNRDGSLSTEWFRGSGSNPDPNRRLKTTGHLLEWLILSLPPEEVGRGRTRNAARYLANLLWQNRQRDWDQGLVGHAVRAMILYDKIVFGSETAAVPSVEAEEAEESEERDEAPQMPVPPIATLGIDARG